MQPASHRIVGVGRDLCGSSSPRRLCYSEVLDGTGIASVIGTAGCFSLPPRGNRQSSCSFVVNLSKNLGCACCGYTVDSNLDPCSHI